MKWVQRIRDFLAPMPDPGDVKFDRAIKLADEVTANIRERAQSPFPFRDVLSEMIMGRPPDIALIADAFEAGQEARIFKGPPNGRG